MRRILLLDHEELKRVVLKQELRTELLPILRASCKKVLGENDKGAALLEQFA